MQETNKYEYLLEDYSHNGKLLTEYSLVVIASVVYINGNHSIQFLDCWFCFRLFANLSWQYKQLFCRLQRVLVLNNGNQYREVHILFYQTVHCALH